jgi:hypothetical protein
VESEGSRRTSTPGLLGPFSVVDISSNSSFNLLGRSLRAVQFALVFSVSARTSAQFICTLTWVRYERKKKRL